MRTLAAYHHLADLPFGVVDQNLALATFNKHHQRSHQQHTDKQHQHQRDRKCAGSRQFQRAADRGTAIRPQCPQK